MLEDLKLFNSIVEELLKEEKINPITSSIKTENLSRNIDIALSKAPAIDKNFKSTLRQLVLKTPKTATNRFFNQLWGGRNSKAILGDLLAVMLNNSMTTYKISGLQIGIEKEIINQICRLTRYGTDSDGTLPSGGSMGNFMAVVMARDKKDVAIRKNGVRKVMTAYTSLESHYSNIKNISFAGIGIDNLRYIETNSFGEMIPEKLEAKIKEDILKGYTPFYVNATSGTTVLGAFDPIEKLSEISKEYNLWLHVDGAICGAVIFSSKYKALLNGVENSDSFSFNAYKMLGTPLTCTVLVVQEKKYLHNSFSNKAPYLYQTHSDNYNLGKKSFQCNRRNDALKFWTLWKAVGTSGLENIVDHLFAMAEIARNYVKNNPDYTLYNTKDSITICFNYKNFEAKDLCTKMYLSNELLVSHGSFNDIQFIRLAIVNSGNTEKDIRNFFKILEGFAKKNKSNLEKRKTVEIF